jgi:NTE family protein
MTRTPALALVVAWALACAQFPENPPLDQWNPAASNRRGRGESGQAILMVAFSGGGTRAAAFAFGVLEELSATRAPDGKRRMLDEIDILSGVSGGSFTAAYYGLHGDGIFEHFEKRFLRRNLQAGLTWRLLNPVNWIRMMSPRFSRSELAASYYSSAIFDDATLGDMSGPEIVINATDLSIGRPFEFTQIRFDMICSDRDAFSVGRAVAASSAVPGPFSPIPLRNHAGSCGFEPPAWFEDALHEGEQSSRRRTRARALSSYLDASRRPYVHLVDGGVADNLAIRTIYDAVLLRGDPQASIRNLGYENVDEIVVLIVNAQRQPDLRIDEQGLAPSLAQLLTLSMGAQMNRYNYETIELVRSGFEAWAAELRGAGRTPRFHLVEVSFDAMADPEERAYLNALPTSLTLPDEDVDRLRRAGRRLLRESSAFQELLRVMGWPSTAEATSP